MSLKTSWNEHFPGGRATRPKRRDPGIDRRGPGGHTAGHGVATTPEPWKAGAGQKETAGWVLAWENVEAVPVTVM